MSPGLALCRLFIDREDLSGPTRYRTPEAERLAEKRGESRDIAFALGQTETWRLVEPTDSPDVFLPSLTVAHLAPTAIWLDSDLIAEGVLVTATGGDSYEVWESLDRIREELAG